MPNIKKYVVFFLGLALFAGTCFAQVFGEKAGDVNARKYYKLEFVLKEVDGGKVVNARAFLATANSEPSNPVAIRTSSRIIVNNSSLETYINIDSSNVREVQGDLYLAIQADITTIIPAPESGSGTQPIIRSNKWSGTVIVPLKKPTVVFASDDITTKRQMQLELTATPVVK